jgi:putative aldouronate transport system permease protein
MQGVKQLPAASGRQKKATPGYRLRTFRENSPYLLMILPAVLLVFLFNYLPIYGVLIAFQDFMPGDAILSDTTIWVGFENFTRFFNDVQFWPLMKNTFILCIVGFVIGFPLPILVSLALNALKRKRQERFSRQSIPRPTLSPWLFWSVCCSCSSAATAW